MRTQTSILLWRHHLETCMECPCHSWWRNFSHTSASFLDLNSSNHGNFPGYIAIMCKTAFEWNSCRLFYNKDIFSNYFQLVCEKHRVHWSPGRGPGREVSTMTYSVWFCRFHIKNIWIHLTITFVDISSRSLASSRSRCPRWTDMGSRMWWRRPCTTLTQSKYSPPKTQTRPGYIPGDLDLLYLLSPSTRSINKLWVP